MRLSAIGLLAALLLKMFDGAYIYGTATQLPDRASERSVEISIHGRHIFITPDQKERLNPMHWSSLTLYGLLALFSIQKGAGR